MKKRMGDIYDYLSKTQVEERMDQCRKLSRQLEKVSCSLDAAGDVLDSTAPTHFGVTRPLERVRDAAIAIKVKFWQPADQSAYAVEKGARDMINRVVKGPIDEKTAARYKKSIKTLKEKAAILEEASARWCKLRHYETVAPPPPRR